MGGGGQAAMLVSKFLEGMSTARAQRRTEEENRRSKNDQTYERMVQFAQNAPLTPEAKQYIVERSITRAANLARESIKSTGGGKKNWLSGAIDSIVGPSSTKYDEKAQLAEMQDIMHVLTNPENHVNPAETAKQFTSTLQDILKTKQERLGQSKNLMYQQDFTGDPLVQSAVARARELNMSPDAIKEVLSSVTAPLAVRYPAGSEAGFDQQMYLPTIKQGPVALSGHGSGEPVPDMIGLEFTGGAEQPSTSAFGPGDIRRFKEKGSLSEPQSVVMQDGSIAHNIRSYYDPTTGQTGYLNQANEPMSGVARKALQSDLPKSSLSPEEIQNEIQSYEAAVNGLTDDPQKRSIYLDAIKAHLRSGTERGQESAARAYQSFATAATRPAGGSSSLSIANEDVDALVDAIVRGEADPRMTQYGYRDRSAIAAGLAKRGFNQANASRDYVAVNRFLSTLSSSRMVNYRQSIRNAYFHLDKLDELYQDWVRSAGDSGMKIINNGKLLVSAQSTDPILSAAADNLINEIKEFGAEMASVYRAGNAPTNESLKLAAGQLQGEWNQTTWRKGMDLMRFSLNSRLRSIEETVPLGITPGSPYNPDMSGTKDEPEGFKQGGGTIDLDKARSGRPRF
jgi:hypothetical protein